MHPDAIEAIERKIKGSLKNCNISNSWPNYELLKSHFDSLSKEILKVKDEWLNTSDIILIFYEIVIDELAKLSEKKDGKFFNGNLWDLIGEEEGNRIAKIVFQYLDKIPRYYDIYFPLPNICDDNIPNEIPLIDNISFSIFQGTGEKERIKGGLPLTPKYEYKNSQKFHIHRRLSGYCRNNIENKCIKKAINDFKILLHQGLYKKVFLLNKDFSGIINNLMKSQDSHEILKAHIVFIDDENKFDSSSCIELPLDLNKMVNQIRLNWESDEIAKAIKNRKIENVLKGYFKDTVELIQCDTKDGIRVKSAIQWCFDSYLLENKTLAFLQVCIGLEALLGDDNNEGYITKTLADRCAYFVSTTVKTRKLIINNFKKLYDIRSKLVHGFKSDLNSDEMRYFEWGRLILERAIMKEITCLNLGK